MAKRSEVEPLSPERKPVRRKGPLAEFNERERRIESTVRQFAEGMQAVFDLNDQDFDRAMDHMPSFTHSWRDGELGKELVGQRKAYQFEKQHGENVPDYPDVAALDERRRQDEAERRIRNDEIGQWVGAVIGIAMSKELRQGQQEVVMPQAPGQASSTVRKPQ